MDGVSVKTFRGAEGLAQAREDWEDLFARMAGRRRYFHCPAWYESYLEALEAHPDRLRFHVAYQEGRPVAVLPVRPAAGRVCGVPARLWEIPHHKHMSLCDPILAPEADRADLWPVLLDRMRTDSETGWDALLLPNLLASSCALAGQPERWRGGCVQRVKDRSDALQYTSHDEFLSRISKNFRANLRKARNKLGKEAQVEFRCCTQAAELESAFQWFVQVEASGWKGQSGTGTAIQSDPALMRFYRGLLKRFGARGACEVNLLLLRNECIAGQFCLHLDDTVYVLKIGYREDHAPLAPGNMLLEWLLQRATTATPPVRCLHLISGVKWHDDWKPVSETVSDVYLFNRTARGQALRRWVGLRLRLGRMYHEWKSAVRREKSVPEPEAS